MTTRQYHYLQINPQHNYHPAWNICNGRKHKFRRDVYIE